MEDEVALRGVVDRVQTAVVEALRTPLFDKRLEVTSLGDAVVLLVV